MPKLIDKIIKYQEQLECRSADMVFMARALICATLPHRKLKQDTFVRRNGDFTLTIIANPDYGLPYGSLARILLAWITTEAVRRKSPEIPLGKNLAKILKSLNLSRRGGVRGDITRLRDQMLRLFTSTISCSYHSEKKGVARGNQFNITRSYQLWWHSIDSKKSSITLAEDFFAELTASPVPLDKRVLHCLQRSPLQMDIYSWLTYRFATLTKETLIPWHLLKYQFGADYAEGFTFKYKFLEALKVVLLIYTDANIVLNDEGIILNPSKTHVPRNC